MLCQGAFPQYNDALQAPAQPASDKFFGVGAKQIQPQSHLRRRDRHNIEWSPWELESGTMTQVVNRREFMKLVARGVAAGATAMVMPAGLDAARAAVVSAQKHFDKMYK
jgi:hypothetical protein